MKRFFLGALLVCNLGVGAASRATPVPDARADVQFFQPPEHTQLTGGVGRRVQLNEANRLVRVDVDRLLEGYRRRPGRQAWDGEHVGKWLHAATLAWANSHDTALREKLDRTVADLVACQLDDGYLGTYLPAERWTEWDVWAHKYNLIGLLTYMQYTGNRAPEAACRRMGDLLCRTFGDASGQRDLMKSGHHAGMASSSVLEPMVLLFRLTGEPRYREFCAYILRAWEQPGGPKIISTLLDAGRVDRVGNAKAYEMLSCLNGVLEYHRLTGDPRCLQAAVNAWEDIVAKRLYVTGAASYEERFHDDFDLPNEKNVGETCVTVTWLQLNAQLLRLTGRARYAEELERVVLNQLFGAQRPDCAAWGYYVQLIGKKPYSDNMDGHCCLSSGPRGVALIPSFAVTTDHAGLVVNLYDAGVADLATPSGRRVSLQTETRYPMNGRIDLTLTSDAAEKFSVRLRIPAWARSATLTIDGAPAAYEIGPDGYATITRAWGQRNRLELLLPVEPRVIVGDHRNAGAVAFAWGPLILAADQSLLPAVLTDLGTLAVSDPTPAALRLGAAAGRNASATWAEASAFLLRTSLPGQPQPIEIPLVPFADAGATGANYQVWLPVTR